MCWETLKAFLQGQFIKSISSIKTKVWELYYRNLERRSRGSPQTLQITLRGGGWKHKIWINRSREKQKHFFLQQKFYEEGENTEHMQAKSSRGSSFIAAGQVVNSHSKVMMTLLAFYADLYYSKVHCGCPGTFSQGVLCLNLLGLIVICWMLLSQLTQITGDSGPFPSWKISGGGQATGGGIQKVRWLSDTKTKADFNRGPQTRSTASVYN